MRESFGIALDSGKGLEVRNKDLLAMNILDISQSKT
jgi:hypothetical protein